MLYYSIQIPISNYICIPPKCLHILISLQFLQNYRQVSFFPLPVMVEWSLLQLEFREEMFQDKILLSPMAAYVKLQYMNMQYETYDVMKNFMIYALGFLSFLLFLEIVTLQWKSMLKCNIWQ